MEKMRRYSTPKLRFHLKGNDLETVLKGTCYLTFGELNLDTDEFTPFFDANFEVEHNTNNGKTYLTTTLTQEQSALWDANTNAYVQFRSKQGTSSIVSSITAIRVLPTIKGEVL